MKGGVPGFLQLAGWRYWTASLLPALVGTTLPFWLRPPGFSFRLAGGIAFFIATILLHAGFSLLWAYFHEWRLTRWAKSRLLSAGSICILIACILGLYINSNLHLGQSVFEAIFLIYGFSVLFVGGLYVIPPLDFSRRIGGEIVLSYSLGLLPVLGATLVQAGDLTRKVYLAALPVMVVTAIWVWIEELGNREEDKNTGRATLVSLFSGRASSRYALLALMMAYFASLSLALISGSLSPLSFSTVILIWPFWKILTKTWNNDASLEDMLKLRKNAFWLHLTACSLLAISLIASSI